MRLGGTNCLRKIGHRFLTILILGLAPLLPAADQPDPDVFTETLKKAIIEQDTETLLSFADSEGLSGEARQRQIESLKVTYPSTNVFAVSLGPLPVDFPPFFIMNGKRYEPTHPPVGIVTISFRQESGLTSKQLAYAIVDGKYKIVATKGTQLDWKGPNDSSLGYILEGTGAEGAVVKIKFNASGVDLERTFHGAAINLWGQHFSEIEVTVDDPKASLALKVLRDGKEIYKSETLTGAGKILYAGDKPRALNTE